MASMTLYWLRYFPGQYDFPDYHCQIVAQIDKKEHLTDFLLFLLQPIIHF